jgi:hypothetical protein
MAPPPAAVPALHQPTLQERTESLGEKLKSTLGVVGTVLQNIVNGLKRTLGRIGKPPQPRGS